MLNFHFIFSFSVGKQTLLARNSQTTIKNNSRRNFFTFSLSIFTKKYPFVFGLINCQIPSFAMMKNYMRLNFILNEVKRFPNTKRTRKAYRSVNQLVGLLIGWSATRFWTCGGHHGLRGIMDVMAMVDTPTTSISQSLCILYN